MQGFEFDEEAARRTARAVVRVESMRDAVTPGRRGRFPLPRKPWYKIVTNDADGAYTVQRQAWDAAANELVNVVDTQDPEYDREIAGFEVRGDDTGAADDIVPGWWAWVDGEWILQIEIGQPATVCYGMVKTLPAMPTVANPDANPLICVVNPCGKDGASVVTGQTVHLYRRWRNDILKSQTPPLMNDLVESTEGAGGSVLAYVPLTSAAASRHWHTDEIYGAGEVVWLDVTIDAATVRINFTSLQASNTGNAPAWNAGEGTAFWAPLGADGHGQQPEGIICGEGWILPKGVALADYRKPVWYGDDGKLRKSWLEIH